jgi:hypothetical protein
VTNPRISCLPQHKAAAKPWRDQWQAGYDTVTVLGGDVLGPTEECVQKLNFTLEEQYRKMEAEHQLIQAATDKLARASTKVTELGDLGRKAKGDPTGTGTLFATVQPYGMQVPLPPSLLSAAKANC